MLEEVVEALKIRPGGVYVDGTFGRGGHTQAILSQLGPEGSMVAFDRDPDAIRAGRDVFAMDFKNAGFRRKTFTFENECVLAAQTMKM